MPDGTTADLLRDQEARRAGIRAALFDAEPRLLSGALDLLRAGRIDQEAYELVRALIRRELAMMREGR